MARYEDDRRVPTSLGHEGLKVEATYPGQLYIEHQTVGGIRREA
jgi:hypothetical protein